MKATRERKKNPMVQKSHLFKKHRTDDKDDDDDSDEASNAATKGFGSTGVSYKTTGAELKNEMKENTFATREVDDNTFLFSHLLLHRLCQQTGSKQRTHIWPHPAQRCQ